MKPTYRNFARTLLTATLTLWLLISMTGCSGRYVVIQGEETVAVKKATIDDLYSDNERLLRALAKCRESKP